MYRTLHEELSRAAEAVRLRQALRAQHEAVARRLEVENTRHRSLAARLRAERKDVARLEGISFQRLFAVIGGELEGKLAQEQAEAAAVELQFVEQDRLVATLRAQLEDLERRIAELGDVDALYREALEAKGRTLVERDDEHGRMVLALAEQHSETCARHREIREAIDCGDELARILAEAVGPLEAARSYGTWDVFGGGAMVTAMKNGQLDEASRIINSAVPVFERFRKELSDIEGMALCEDEAAGDGGRGAGSWLIGFADYTFGLFVDMLIQRKIERLAADVATLRERVRLRLEQLMALEAENLVHRRERRKRLEELIHAG